MSPEECFSFIHTHFPEISPRQAGQFEALYELYFDWNEKINVISRKDFEHFHERHLLHSLSIGLYQDLNSHSVMDVGTGGGFPGVPLAILFPDAGFTLVDSIGKKLKVVEDVAAKLGLSNIECIHGRMESLSKKYDFITGRAVTELPQLFNWTKHLVHWHKGKENSGMLYLKGGEFTSELKKVPRKVDIYNLNEHFESEFFETKKLVRIFQ
jgi:16S rRNA (guanine527-N7)-methyltransferase